jgi:hypothetical protein
LLELTAQRLAQFATLFGKSLVFSAFPTIAALVI